MAAKPNKSKTETYEDDVKKAFIEQPANMKLLIVVDKLLTGFDAPSCSYLYIDKSMQDHGLFQAICRVNRLDSDDKTFGYIVDYKDLFKNVEHALTVYTEELDYDAEDEATDSDILLKDRLKVGRERLEAALEAIELLCEPVKSPKDHLDYQRYFCGNSEIADDLKETEVKRHGLYKATVVFIRAYANITDEMDAAGYNAAEQKHIKARLEFYLKLREVIRKASGEVIDLKAYEADMRYLIDHYIQATDAKVVSPFKDMSLLDVIVNIGIDEAVDNLPEGIKGNNEAVSETIENNVRSKIIKSHFLDPVYFKEMSTLLDALIKQRKKQAIKYADYLKKMDALVRKVQEGKKDDTPSSLNTTAKRALYHNLGKDESLAVTLDNVVNERKPAYWRGNQAKENTIKQAVYDVLKDVDEVERIFEIIKQQQEY
ncbi:MAG: hypothetical protein GQ582_02965 [Methyloprofundus sp.]|nr:hypothetical protein [Methyloprofundus sp.]